MNKPKLSVIIITLNEEKDLPRCLDSIKRIADEIVVVDSGSADRTVEVAKKYGAKVYQREFDNYSNQKNFAASKADGKWLLSLDADEIITKELAREIREAIKVNGYDGYLIPRRNFILGVEIKHARWSPDKHIWLWKKNRGEWEGAIHEEVVVRGEIGELENAKIHYSYKTISEFLGMVNDYTGREAEEKIKKGIKFSLFRMFFDPCLSFFRRYIYKKGFLDGWQGLVLSYLMAFYRFATWVKVWERQR